MAPNHAEMAPNDELLRASERGDVAAVRALLGHGGVDVNARDKYEWTPLYNASYMGHVEVVELLMKANADLNLADKDGWTPLHGASSNGRKAVVELLLNAKADLNVTTQEGFTPLYAASRNDHKEVVELLLMAKVDPNISDKAGWTPLYAVSRYARVEVVELLLKASVEPNIAANDGQTPLYTASDAGHVEVVELLLKAKADLTLANKNGFTPLHIASRNGHVEVVELLLKAAADPNVADIVGETPLHSAVQGTKRKVVELLLNANADPNAAAERKRTPLHSACENHKSEVARLLLSSGSELHAKDNEGLEPLHVCIRRDPFHQKYDTATLETVQVLVSSGATWDAKCDEIIASGEGRGQGLALRVCVLVWAQEHADGLPFTHVDVKTIERGPKQTETYIEEIKKSTQIKYRRKICIVGPSKAGKTTLVKSLTARQPSLVHPDDRTIGVDQIVLRFGVKAPGDKHLLHEVTFWDFAGQDEYQVAHSLFFSARTLYLVCVDLESFLVAYLQADLMAHSKTQCEQLMNEFIERDILRWVRVIFSHQPDAEFVFIATKDDLLIEFPDFTKEVKTFLATKLDQVEGIVGEMKREVVEQVADGERRANELTIHAYEKRMEMRHAPGSDQDAISRDTTCGQAVECERDAAAPAKIFTNLQAKFAWGRRVYHQLVSTVRSRTHATKRVTVDSPVRQAPRERPSTIKRETLYVSCSDVNSVEYARRAIIALIARSDLSFQMPDSYTDILNAIVEIRQAAGQGKSDARVARMFAPVVVLVNSLVAKMEKMEKDLCVTVLQTLHDLGDVLWYENLGIELFEKTVILDPLLLIDFVRQVITHHSKSEKLAHGELMSLPFWVGVKSEEQILAIKRVLQIFQLVHPSNGEMKWNSDLIVPAFWKSKTPASWLFGYEDVRLTAAMPSKDPNQPDEQVRVHWQYHFAHEFPDSLFDHLVVATHSPYMYRDAGPDWILYAKDGIFACRAMISRGRQAVHRVLQLEVVLAKTADETETEQLWEAFECLSEGVVKVLRRYRGLVVTSVALDDRYEMHDLDSLFALELKVWSRTWMPRAKSWEQYKSVVGYQRQQPFEQHKRSVK